MSQEVNVNKRLLITMVLMFSVASYNFADVTIKDIDGTNVEIIITYTDDEVSEPNVIGSFNSWIEPGTAMVKNAAGVWELKLNAIMEDEIIYKFYIDGNYITDDNAPDFKDDGFAGLNGLILVADVLAEQAIASAPVVEGQEPIAKVYKSKLNFGMYTILGSKSTFVTQGLVDKTDKGFEADTTGLYAKSYWKMGGSIVPDVKMWFEIAAFDAYQPIWGQDATGEVTTESDDGISSLIGGMLVNPVNYMGSKTPELNSVKLGIDSEYVNWETGYGYAKPQGRTALLWETIGEVDANNGYMRFDLGSKLQEVGPAKIELTIAPNVMNGNYSLFSWLGATMGKTQLDFQYDVKSAASDDLSEIFDKFYHQDFIIGAKTKVSKFDISTQCLINLFSEEDFKADDHIAGEAKISGPLGRSLGTIIGYRYTGSSSELLYGENDDALGDKGMQRISLNIHTTSLNNLKVGLTSTVYLAETTSDEIDQVAFRPNTDIKIRTLDATAKVYGILNYTWEKDKTFANSREKFLFSEAGINFIMPSPFTGIDNIDIKYGFNNDDEDKFFNTIITSLRMPNNLSAEIGLGIKTVKDYASTKVKDENNLIGFSVGGSWKIPVRKIKSPLLYGAFVYNMDPYDDDTNSLEMDDYVTTDGVDKNDGYAQFRLMVKWDF